MKPTPDTTVLFLSPAIPKSSGIGIAMRAAALLRALSELATVDLVVINLTRSETATEIPPETTALCRNHVLIDPSRPASYARFGLQKHDLMRGTLWPRFSEPANFLSPAACRRLAAVLPGTLTGQLRAIFAFRLSMAPLALALQRHISFDGAMLLDLDDYESRARSRMADILRLQNGRRWFLGKKIEALQYWLQESRYVPHFSQVFVSSRIDPPALSARFGRRVATLPNTVQLPTDATPSRPHDTVNILFVGACSYPPNQDGIRFFLDQVLPRIRAAASRSFRIMIVGRRTTDTLAEYAGTPNVDLVGEVPEVADYYRQADLAIAPIRVGGGTRIKILEALSYRVPVVATPIGAEGITVKDGDNMLIGADAEGFAKACLRLMDDPALRARLAEQGYATVVEEFSGDVIRNTLADALLAPAR